MNNAAANNPDKLIACHNYSGAVHTPESLVAILKPYLNTTENNLTMRLQLAGFGYNRTSRAFASAVMDLIK